MENDLKKLHQTMDIHLSDKKVFTMADEQRVLNKIGGTKSSPKKKIFLFPRMLTAVLAAVFLLGAFTFVKDMSQPMDSSSKSADMAKSSPSIFEKSKGNVTYDPDRKLLTIHGSVKNSTLENSKPFHVTYQFEGNPKLIEALGRDQYKVEKGKHTFIPAGKNYEYHTEFKLKSNLNAKDFNRAIQVQFHTREETYAIDLHEVVEVNR